MIYMTDHNSIMRPALNTRDTIVYDSFTTSAEMRSNCCYTAIVHNKLFAKHVFFASFIICCLFFSENLKLSLRCIYLTIHMILFISPHLFIISPHLMGLQHKITPYPLKVHEKFHTFKIKKHIFLLKSIPQMNPRNVNQANTMHVMWTQCGFTGVLRAY